jgi:hypothetical protein
MLQGITIFVLSMFDLFSSKWLINVRRAAVEINPLLFN